MREWPTNAAQLSQCATVQPNDSRAIEHGHTARVNYHKQRMTAFVVD